MGRIKKHIQHPVGVKQKLVRLVIHIFGWIGIALLYYLGFYLFFDTPIEYEMRQSTSRLESEYEKLIDRYDTLQRVLENIEERDKFIYRTMFEAEPYTEGSMYQQVRQNTLELLADKSNRDLGEMFFFKLNHYDQQSQDAWGRLTNLYNHVEDNSNVAYIPKIQPITNKDLTLLATSFGMRIQPFYKAMNMHRGVDYAAAIGTRVYATADGVVSESSSKSGSHGVAVKIRHGDSEYETLYSHLSRTTVKKGQRVREGDIIGLTGNSGLSFAPHLHYEVIYKGVSVDPVNYFFGELDPSNYHKIKQVAASGMQSLD